LTLTTGVAGRRPSEPPAPLPMPRAARLTATFLRPLVPFAAVSCLQLVVLAWMTSGGRGSIMSRLLAWDAVWYLQIARDGYAQHVDVAQAGSLEPHGQEVAFLPLYPYTVRLVHLVTGLGLDSAAVVTAWVASSAAAVLVFHLVAGLYDRRTASIAVALLGSQPMSLVLLMGYAEGLFIALAAGALLAAHRGAWWWAASCSLLAGLTRAGGVAVAAALALAAAQWLWQRRTWDARVVGAVLLGALGTPAYLCSVALRTGRLDGWFAVQRIGWATRLDWGASTFSFLATTFQSSDGWVPVSVAILLVASVVTVVVAAMLHIWPPLVAYGGLIVALALLQSNYFHSKPRLLVPALVLVLPASIVLRRFPSRAVATVLFTAALLGTWYGAYMVTVWPYAI
jgi:hypothetical protein